MDWSATVDLYCERLGPAFWAEPVNALSNLSFIIAAGLLARELATMDREHRPTDLTLLVALIGLVGIGSFIFHTTARVGTSVLDVGFIALYVLTWLQRFVVRIGRGSNTQAWLVVAAFVAGDRLLAALVPADFANGSVLYLPTLLALGGCALWSRHGAPVVARPLFQAAGLFLLSLTLRSIDQTVCTRFPIGTHFAWHLLNGLLLYRTTRVLWPRAHAQSV